MPRYERGPQWDDFGLQIKAARDRMGINQGELAKKIGFYQTTVSRDENGNGTPLDRIERYCDFFGWDYDTVVAFVKNEGEAALTMMARRDYLDLFRLLDGKLRDGEEQDLIDEALQLVILHRYPGVSVAAFATSPDAG